MVVGGGNTASFLLLARLGSTGTVDRSFFTNVWLLGWVAGLGVRLSGGRRRKTLSLWQAGLADILEDVLGGLRPGDHFNYRFSFFPC